MTSLLAFGLLAVVPLAGCAHAEPLRHSPSPTVSPQRTFTAASPNETTAVGAFAEGLPEYLKEIPDGAKLLLSTAKPEGDADQVSLSFTYTGSPSKVVNFYDKLLGSRGFTSKPEAETKEKKTRVRAYTGEASALELTIVGDKSGSATIAGTVKRAE